MSSNLILARLEDNFEKYLLGKLDKYEFGSYLINSIQALEAINYETIQIARDFQYKFEIAEFSDEESSIEGIETVTLDFRRWLKNL